MKKIICLVVVMLALVQLIISVGATEIEHLQLSEMSESECIAFIKSKGVSIPNDYEDEMAWGNFAKRIITQVEADPNCVFSYNYHVTLAFAESIRTAVNDYYGVNEQKQKSTLAANTARASSLLESEFVGEWHVTHDLYNCYGYAIGRHTGFYYPGYFSEGIFSLSLSISEMAQLVVDDLVELEYENVSKNTTYVAPCTGQSLICIRKCDEDFHFMKYSGGAWYHKPGRSQILKYKYQPSLVRLWTNEGRIGTEIYSGTIRYDSVIYYITYGNDHTWSYVPHSITGGTHYHIQKCSECSGYGKSSACIYKGGSNACSICGWNKNTPLTALAELNTVA